MGLKQKWKPIEDIYCYRYVKIHTVNTSLKVEYQKAFNFENIPP